jgi:hypothetical protein
LPTTAKVVKGSTSSKNKKPAKKFYVESVSSEWNLHNAQLQGQQIPRNDGRKKIRRENDIKTPFEEYKTSKVTVEPHSGFNSSQQVSVCDDLMTHSIDDANLSLPKLVLPI